MITQERAIELFDYDPEAGTIVMRSGAAGWYEDGYLRFTLPTIDGRIKVRAHQVAWLIIHNEWVSVDHEDLNKSNIKIVNLRSCNGSQNAANQRKKSTNSTGIKGVSFCSATGKYRASITVRGKSLNLGRYNHIQEAALAYASAARKHFGEFARTE